MRRFLALFVVLPIAVVVVVLSVANRGSVIFSLNPIGGVADGWAVSAPLYVFLFFAVLCGIIIGGIATWIRQGRWRHAARAERARADRLRADVAQLRAQMEATTPALGSPRSDRNAA
ncbi:MAG TPA: lipopolysaccharide assembly protein LapA domain-containing protein [Bauldia sp.]